MRPSPMIHSAQSIQRSWALNVQDQGRRQGPVRDNLFVGVSLHPTRPPSSNLEGDTRADVERMAAEDDSYRDFLRRRTALALKAKKAGFRTSGGSGSRRHYLRRRRRNDPFSREPGLLIMELCLAAKAAGPALLTRGPKTRNQPARYEIPGFLLEFKVRPQDELEGVMAGILVGEGAGVFFVGGPDEARAQRQYAAFARGEFFLQQEQVPERFQFFLGEVGHVFKAAVVEPETVRGAEVGRSAGSRGKESAICLLPCAFRPPRKLQRKVRSARYCSPFSLPSSSNHLSRMRRLFFMCRSPAFTRMPE